LKEHFWDVLGMVYVSGDCEDGHLELTEELGSRIIGKVNFGTSRTFTIRGGRPGRISLDAFPGYNEFTAQYEPPSFDPPAFRAFLTSSIILLTRAIRHHDD